jgi:hypothetical protein
MAISEADRRRELIEEYKAALQSFNKTDRYIQAATTFSLTSFGAIFVALSKLDIVLRLSAIVVAVGFIIMWFPIFYRLDVVSHAMVSRIYELEEELEFSFNRCVKQSDYGWKISRITMVAALGLIGLLVLVAVYLIFGDLKGDLKCCSGLVSICVGAMILGLIAVLALSYVIMDYMMQSTRRRQKRDLRGLIRAGIPSRVVNRTAARKARAGR